MTRLVPALCVAAALAVGGTTWVLLSARAHEHLAVPTTPGAAPQVNAGPATALVAARRSCKPEALDPVIAELTRAAEAAAADAAAPWHLLADAHLERALARSHRRGLRVGEPTWSELPVTIADDVRLGLEAAAKAKQRGDETADLLRIEAALLSQRITGVTSALQWNGRIHAALQRAGELGKDDPRVHVAIGLRQLLAPKWFGHDAEKALEHFEFAARSLADDERPSVFAAMACHLQKKRQQAIDWLERAVATNPANLFARVVLKRLRAGEDEPFGRELGDAEIAAAAAGEPAAATTAGGK